jgi:hypothetical protein
MFKLLNDVECNIIVLKTQYMDTEANETGLC